jgi:hypothetical protein
MGSLDNSDGQFASNGKHCRSLASLGMTIVVKYLFYNGLRCI